MLHAFPPPQHHHRRRHHHPPSTAMTTHRRFLIVVYTGQGHINPALVFANRLLRLGVDVTFSTSLSAVRRLDKQTTPHGLTFAPFSDGHDDGKQPDTTLQQFISDFAANGACAVAETIISAAAAGQPFDHLIYTTAAPWAATVASAHNVKSTLLWCQPAVILDIYYYFNGYETMISGNKNNPSFPINLPGLPPLTMADLPSFFSPSKTEEDEFILSLFKDQIEVLKIAPRVLVNTFYDLEIDPIKAIDKIHFLPIGPLIPPELLEEKNPPAISSDYIHWLNTKPKSSVVYVSFGSISTLSTQQAEEMAIGLLESRQPFLWVIRNSEEALKLRKIEELKKQGMIVNWCSQVEVLRHPAIGCFVTHCGWNSTVETVVAGVPVVAFPQWTDQGTNAKMIEDVWKIGVRVRRKDGDEIVEGKELERCVKMVIEDEEMKKSVEKWRMLAREAINNGGSSSINLQAFLDDA